MFGQIEKITFEGTIVRYEIRLVNGDRFVINRPSLTEDWVSIGQEVTITYPLDKGASVSVSREWFKLMKSPFKPLY